jgi:hypothetical protein
MFRKNNAILREELFSFLSHFNVNMVGDKSEYNKYIQGLYYMILLYSGEVAQKGT